MAASSTEAVLCLTQLARKLHCQGRCQQGPAAAQGSQPHRRARAVPAPWHLEGQPGMALGELQQVLPCWRLSSTKQSPWVWVVTYSSGQRTCQRWLACGNFILQNSMRLCELFCFLKAENSTVSVIIFVWSPQEACGLTIMHNDCINQ